MSERLGHGHTCHSVNINMRVFRVYHFLHRKNQTHLNYRRELVLTLVAPRLCVHRDGNEVDLRC